MSSPCRPRLVSAPTVQGASAVTLMNPIPVGPSVSPQTIGVGAFTIQVNGSGFLSGAQVMFGTTALTTTFVSATELIGNGYGQRFAGRATSSVTVVNPAPGTNNSTTSATAQVTTGTVETVERSRPLPRAIHVWSDAGAGHAGAADRLSGISHQPIRRFGFHLSRSCVHRYLSCCPTQQALFTNALNNPDQLRQRVALALSEIWVTSGFTVPPQGMAPYMRLLLQDAFVNYRTLMNDVTLSPAMGRYLDMVNNDNPPSGAARQ